MLRELHDASSAARQVFEEASDAIGYDMARVAFEDPDAVLNRTEFTQPVLLVASVAAFRGWVEGGGAAVPALALGLSLGEYSALVVAGALRLDDAVRITRARGRAMQEAVPMGVGAMAAIVGLPGTEVASVCRGVAETAGWVQVANYNSPEQVVISGETAAVREACVRLKAAGARRALPLPVSAPFHSRLLQPAADVLARVLADVTICAPVAPVICNVSATPTTDPEAIRSALVSQVASPVLLAQSLQRAADMGITRYVEFGPGQTMANLVRATVPGIAVSVSDVATLGQALTRTREN